MKSLEDSLLRSVPYPVVKVGPGNEILGFNRHFLELTGQTRESLKDRPVLEIVDAAVNGSGAGRRHRTARIAKQPLYRTFNVTGDPVYLRTHVVEYRDEGGIDARLLLFQDETEQASLRDENQHLARLASVGKLLSFVVHEIGNFTAVIKGCAQLIEARSGVDDGTRGDARRIEEETDRVSEIIRRFLGFARKDDNELEMIPAASLLRDIVDLKNFTLKRKKVSIGLDVREQTPVFIRGNRTLLMQVLMNLVDNAEEAVAGQPNAEIRLTLSRSKREIVIEVFDSGPGIPKTQTHKIFDAFFTTKKGGGGTGLGLPIARRIARNHEGELLLLRSEPGIGTVFQIRLPAAAAPDARRQAAASRQGPRRRGLESPAAGE